MAAGDLNGWWRFGLLVGGPLVRLLFRIRVIGLEHVPARGGIVVAFNHVSALDGPVLAIELGRAAKRPPRFLVAAEFFEKRFHGWVLRTFDQIPIRRGESDGAALDAVLDALHDGSVVAIAPEGAVSPSPDSLQRVRRGVARLALPTGTPIIPVGIWGTQQRWPRGGLRWGSPWRPRVAIVFGPPLLPDGDVAVEADIEALTERLRDRLVEQVAESRSLVEQG